MKGDVPKLVDSGNVRWSAIMAGYSGLGARYNTGCVDLLDDASVSQRVDPRNRTMEICAAQPGTHFSRTGKLMDGSSVAPSVSPLFSPSLFPHQPRMNPTVAALKPSPDPSVWPSSQPSEKPSFGPTHMPVPAPSSLSSRVFHLSGKRITIPAFVNDFTNAMLVMLGLLALAFTRRISVALDWRVAVPRERRQFELVSSDEHADDEDLNDDDGEVNNGSISSFNNSELLAP